MKYTDKARAVAATARGYLWWAVRYQWWLLRHIPRGIGRVAGWARKFIEWVAAGKTFQEDAVRLILGILGLGIIAGIGWAVLTALAPILWLPYDAVEGFIYDTTGVLLPPEVAFWAAVYAAALAVGWYGTRGGTTAAAVKPDDNAESTRLYGIICECVDRIAKRTENNPDALTVGKFTGDHAGRTVTVTLPIGFEVKDLPRAKIASGWGIKTEQLTITNGDTDRHAVLRFADVSPSTLPPAPWPLVNADSFDLTRPIPIGETLDGNPAGLQLFSRDSRGDLQGFHLLLTGMSRYGKSTLLRTILAACALDERAVLNVAVPQDTRDFEDIEPALSYLAVDASIEDLRAMLARAKAHMSARAGVPYVVVLDEAQLALGEKGGDKEAIELTRDLLSAGGKNGIALILCTQEPTKANLHPDLARRPQNRISFRQTQNETAERAMGRGMTADTDPSLFRGGDKGLAAVIGEDGFHGKVKTPLLDHAAVARIARQHTREPFQPAQETPPARPHLTIIPTPEPEAPAETVVDHCRQVWPPTLDRIAAEHLATLLPMASPAYDNWGTADLRKALRGHGIEIKGIKIGGKSTQGLYRAQLEQVGEGGLCDRVTV